MLSIGVQNLRSLYNIDEIEIKPITVLLGKNSAGKSTFLRMFPLLKQSIEDRTSEPILWYGDYVDFGDFEESKCKNINKEKKMKIQLISRLEYLFQKEIENITEGIDICRIISSISMIIICLNLMKRMKKIFR